MMIMIKIYTSTQHIHLLITFLAAELHGTAVGVGIAAMAS
jgi:hypothetical protein